MGFGAVKRTSHLPRATFIGLALLSLTFFHCDCGTDPEIDVEFSTLWPNGDGSSWTFDFIYYSVPHEAAQALHGFDPDDAESIDFEAIVERFQWDPPPVGDSPVHLEQDTFCIELNGTIETDAGEKQKLIYCGAEDPVPPYPLGGGENVLSPLRNRNLALSASLYLPGPIWPGTNSGTAWEIQENWLGYFYPLGLGSDSAYTILRGPLEVGSDFRHQLATFQSKEIWEYGWVVGMKTIETAIGTFNALQIVYFVDLGTSDIISEDGEQIGVFHAYSISTLYLAPGVGPVYQSSYDYFAPELEELGISEGALFSEVKLLEFSLAE